MLLRTLKAPLLDPSCGVTVSAIARMDGSITEWALSATQLTVKAGKEVLAMQFLYCCLGHTANADQGFWAQHLAQKLVTIRHSAGIVLYDCQALVW